MKKIDDTLVINLEDFDNIMQMETEVENPNPSAQLYIGMLRFGSILNDLDLHELFKVKKISIEFCREESNNEIQRKVSNNE